MGYSELQYAAYTNAQFHASKCEQVIMLYDGAIRFIQKAIDAIGDNNIQERYNHLTRAQHILIGLQSALDFDQGGDIAQLLYSYYHGLDMRLMGVHRNNDVATCQQAIEELTMMKEAWVDVDNSTSAKVVSDEEIASLVPQELTQQAETDSMMGNISVDI